MGGFWLEALRFTHFKGLAATYLCLYQTRHTDRHSLDKLIAVDCHLTSILDHTKKYIYIFFTKTYSLNLLSVKHSYQSPFSHGAADDIIIVYYMHC